MEDKKDKRKNGGKKSGKHKTPRTMVNIRRKFVAKLEQLQERLGFETMTELVNQLVREGLQRHGLWSTDEQRP